MADFNAADFIKSNEFMEAVAAISTQASNARIKQFKKETLDEVGAKFEAFGKALAPQFEEIKTAIGQPKPKKNKDKPDDVGDTPEDARNVLQMPEFRTLTKKIEELEATNKKERELRMQESAKRQNMLVRNKLREVLEANGVKDPVKIRAASAILIDADRRVQWSDTLEDAAVIDTDGAPIELDQGIRSWLQSDEGQHYQAPVGAGGTGSRPRRNGAPPEPPPKITETDIGGALLAVLGKNVNG